MMKRYDDSGSDIRKLLPYAAGLLLAAAVVFTVMASTLLSKSYVKRKFSESRVYVDLTDRIREQAAKAYLKTDPPKEVKNNINVIMIEIITEEAVRQEADEVVEKLLSGQDPKVDGSYLRSSISSNVAVSLSARNISMSASQTNELIEKSVNTASDTIDISKYTDKIPVKLSGGAFRAIIFAALALAAIVGVYLISYNKMLDMGKVLLVGGGVVLIVGIAITSAFDPSGMGLPLASLTNVASALKSAITSRCVIFGLIFTAAGGGMFLFGKKAY